MNDNGCNVSDCLIAIGLWLVTTPVVWSLSVVLGALLAFILWHKRGSRQQVDDHVHRDNDTKRPDHSSGDDTTERRSFRVIYATQTGTAKVSS